MEVDLKCCPYFSKQALREAHCQRRNGFAQPEAGMGRLPLRARPM
jgi:hypothetical protein